MIAGGAVAVSRRYPGRVSYASAVSFHVLAAAATAVAPFWQSSAGGIILGGGITLATTITIQLFTERRTARREAHASEAAKRARRITFQIDTITELQEEIEAIAAFIGNALASTMLDKLRTKTNEYMPGLVSFGRVGLLCTRLEDEALRTRIRTWLRETREYANTPGVKPGDAKGVDLRDQRIEIVDALGTILQHFHQPDLE